MNLPCRQMLFGLSALAFLGCASHRSALPVHSTDSELSRTAQLAHTAWDQGSLGQAETLFRQAHRRARAMDDAPAVGDAAYNLAAVLLARGPSGEARTLLDEALVAFERANLPATDVFIVQAKLASADHQPADAERWLDIADKTSGVSPAHRLQIALLRGELACRSKEIEKAKSNLAFAQSHAMPGNLTLVAETERLSGEIALLEHDPATAAAAFDREVKNRRDSQNYRAMAQALARAGDAFATAGDLRSGADRLYRAARCRMAQDELDTARPLVQRAKSLAMQGGALTLTQLLEQLERELPLAKP